MLRSDAECLREIELLATELEHRGVCLGGSIVYNTYERPGRFSARDIRDATWLRTELDSSLWLSIYNREDYEYQVVRFPGPAVTALLQNLSF